MPDSLAPLRQQLDVLVTPAYGEPTGEVRELVHRIREHIRVWLR